MNIYALCVPVLPLNCVHLLVPYIKKKESVDSLPLFIEETAQIFFLIASYESHLSFVICSFKGSLYFLVVSLILAGLMYISQDKIYIS